MALKWQQKPTSLPVSRYGRNLEKQVRREARTTVAEMEGYAKVHRPWQDDTGAARAGLRGFIEEQANAIILVIAHSVDYGIYLELAGGGRFKALLALVRANPAALETVQAGRYAILWPTVQHYVPVLKQRLRALGLRWDR
jgi:hypothetical protein